LKYVSELTADELMTLESAYKNHPTGRVRNRAQIIILSHKRYNLVQIADVCQATRQTVSSLISKWEKHGLAGLYDAPRPGKPRILKPDDEDFIFEMIEDEPRSTNKLIAILEDQRGKKVSASTLKRVIKKNWYGNESESL
jgi:transposase